MGEDKKTYQLIVCQAPASNPRLEPLAKLLMEEFGLDAYTARIRLGGSGKAFFGSGPKAKTAKLAEVLSSHGYKSWMIERSEVKSSPFRLRDIEIAPDVVRLATRDKVVQVNRGANIVAVIADVSGKLEERTLKRHAVQSRYKHAEHIVGMADEKMVESVLKGQPVLDIYLLDKECQPQDAVRVFPGRYNAKGLGDRMTMSATRNLQAIIDLLKEYAGHFSLHADFGLGRLPDCQIKSLDGKYLSDDEVLRSLTRFGWLMCDLEQDRGRAEEKPEEVDPALAAVAVAAGRPGLAAAMASGDIDALPGLQEVVDEIKSATAEAEKADTESVNDEEWLPLPPDRPAGEQSARMVLSASGIVFLVVVLVLISQGGTSLLGTLARYSVKAGALPGLLAAGLFWSGFYFLQLKRRIENTPTSRIRSMAMGMVEVHGKTVRKYALVSPINQSACVYYRLRKYKRDNRNNWVLRSDKDSRHVPFLLDDGTGRVTVDPAGALVRAKTSRSGLPGEAMLAFHGVSDDNPDEKWVENIIFEGTSLYVLGFARPLKEKRKSLRERTVEKLRDLKLDRKALHRYDADGDGRISEDEWQVARVDAEQSALREHLSEGTSSKKQEEHAVIAKPSERGLPFVITETADEAHLVRNYGLFSVPLFGASLVAAGFALYHFLEFLGS